MIHAIDFISQTFLPYFLVQICYSAILFLFVYAVILVFRLRSARWQAGLWMLVFLRLVLPPDLHSDYSGRTLLASLPAVRQLSIKIHSFFDTEQGKGRQALLNGGFSPDDGKGLPFRTPHTAENPLNRLYVVLFVVWFLGIFIFLGHLIRQQRRYNNILRRAEPVRDKNILRMCAAWKLRFKVRRHIQIKSSHSMLSPFTAGVFKPVIYLPQRVIARNDNILLESVIAHEMAHIHRLDHIGKRLQTFIQICYFFHPAVWIAGSRLNIARECLCDELVLGQNRLPARCYGQGILDILKLNLMGAHKNGLLLSFGSPAKKMNYRLQQLLKGGVMKTYQKLIVYGCIIVIGMLVLPMGPVISTYHAAAADGPKAEDADVEMICPLKKGRVTARFGPMLDPLSLKKRHHRGIDIATTRGSEIYAAADGRVTATHLDADAHEAWGHFVRLDHGQGIATCYTHMKEVKVTPGETVKKGRMIGTVGSTGRSTGPHLHFEIIQNGDYVNPQDFVDFSGLE